ncbi:MAG TPA: DUF6142 family protein [Lachnospiraceae bacterium]|jgi:EamA domain-containing membrane protein RarD|nr:DUF6142 family protein [Lachnospiraceae bacterium]
MAKKSFMFTTRHHSRNGIISVILGVLSLAGLIAAIILSFANRGATPLRLGGAGLVGMISAVLGFCVGMYSTRERDVYLVFPRAGVILNVIAAVAWSYIIVVGIYGINY